MVGSRRTGGPPIPPMNPTTAIDQTESTVATPISTPISQPTTYSDPLYQ